MNKIKNTTKKTNLNSFFCVFVFISLVLFTPQISFAWQETLNEILWLFVTTTFGNLALFSGYILDYTITNFVVGFGYYFTNNGIGFAVEETWKQVRDIFNLTFIFGLVYIGFKMILDSSDNGAKKGLGLLIMAALLVNFSLFFTKSVIDFSHITAKVFVEHAKQPGENGTVTYNIAEKLMSKLNAQNINKIGEPEDMSKVSLAYIFGAMYLYIITAFVFAAGAILLFIRFVALVIYMILSPVMFIGWVLPNFSSLSKKYMDGFLKQALFAPAYFAMVYFSFRIIDELKEGLGQQTASLGDAFSGLDYTNSVSSIGGTLMFFFLACGFMIGSLIVAKQMGAVGASKAISIGKMGSSAIRKRTQQTAGSVAFGGTARILQNTAGRAGSSIANSDKMKRWAAKSQIASGLRKTASYAGDASFDARRVAGLGKATGIGDGKKGGWDSRIKESNKADKKFADDFGTIEVKKDLDGRYLDAEQQSLIEQGVIKQGQDENSYLYQRIQVAQKAEDAERLTREAKQAREAKIAADKEVHDKAIAEAENRLKNTADPDIRLEIEQEIAKEKDAKIRIDTEAKNEMKVLEEQEAAAQKATSKAKESLRKAERDAIASEESKLIYANQIAFMERRQKEVGRLNGLWSKLGLVGGGAVGATTIGAVGALPAAAVGFLSANTYSAQYQASYNNLVKEFGTDGRKAKKAKEKKDSLSILQEQLNDHEKDSGSQKTGKDETDK